MTHVQSNKTKIMGFDADLLQKAVQKRKADRETTKEANQFFYDKELEMYLQGLKDFDELSDPVQLAIFYMEAEMPSKDQLQERANLYFERWGGTE